MEDSKGSLDLEKNVHSQGICTGCGACVGLCPYIGVARDRVAVIEHCRISEGQCFDFCPRTHFDISALDKKVFGNGRKDFSLGPHITVKMSQACDSNIRDRAQYGGTVSALMKYAMDLGLIDRSILNRPFNDSLMPKPMKAEESSQVLECSGSNYVSSAILADLNRSLKQGGGTIGMVGIPCQVQALRKMQGSNHKSGADRVDLVIGLFCTWALSFNEFSSFLGKMADTSDIRRIDIPPPPAGIMLVETGTGSLEIPLEDIRAFIKPACSVCYDMTAEFADISVGMVEGMEDRNTLIVRTREGAELVEKAEENGIIETGSLDASGLEHLKEASILKKRRAVDELKKRTGDEKDLLYLCLSKKERNLICQ